MDGNNPLCFFYCSVFYFASSASHQMQSILPLNNVDINELIIAVSVSNHEVIPYFKGYIVWLWTFWW